MIFTKLGVAATLAGLTRGFLVPPEISQADKDIINTLPFEDAVAADGRVVEINCPGCPVMTDIQGKMHSAQVDSILLLNFTLLHSDADQLLLNGLPVYPVDIRSPLFMQPLTASQMIKNSDNIWEYASTPKLGYSLSVRHPLADSTQDQLSLVAIHLDIVEVADKFLTGIPSIELKLLETPSGKLMIGGAEISAPQDSESQPSTVGQECTTLLCKWKAIIANKVSEMKKGCKGKARPTPHAGAGSKPHHGHGRPNGHGRPHGKHHNGVARFLRGIVIHVFIPLLIGVMVGITASLVGMAVGHLAIFTWRLLFRRNKCGQYIKVQQDEIVEDSSDKADEFLGSQGPPPEYEEAVTDEKA